MADSILSALTASTPGTAGLLYTVQGGADRKLDMTAAGASIIEAVNAAAQLSLLGAQPLATILTTLGNLSNAAGVLTNNGSGALSYTSISMGGNAAADSGKLALFGTSGELIAQSFNAAEAGDSVLLSTGGFIFSSGVNALTVATPALSGVNTITFANETGTVAL